MKFRRRRCKKTTRSITRILPLSPTHGITTLQSKGGSDGEKKKMKKKTHGVSKSEKNIVTEQQAGDGRLQCNV